MHDTLSTESSISDGEIFYRYKPSLIGAGCEFKLAPDGLHWEVGGSSGRIPYTAIRRIRLSFRPVTLAAHRFTAEIWSDAAPKMIVASTSWRSLVEQERQDAGYSAFVRALSRQVGMARRDTLFETGSARFIYWPGVVIFVGLGVTLTFMLGQAALAGTWKAAAVIGGILLVLLWQLGTFFWRNRPGTYQPEAVPRTVLPRG